MINDSDTLVRRLVGGDLAGVRQELRAAGTQDTPVRLLVAALVADDSGPQLQQASRLARTTRDRQLVAITTAHLAGESDRVAVLVRDHLVEHPDSLLAAWIATQHTTGTTTSEPQE